MKVKKEILILIGIIVVLGVYLTQRKTDRTHYTLPDIPKLEAAELDKIEISRGEETLTLNKKDEQWFIAPRDKLADKDKVTGMAEALAGLEVTALVSEAASYARYELDEGNRIGLKGWQGDQQVRQLDLGKAASTFQHTFVKLPDNPNVYHASGHLRPKFEFDAEGLRDLTVFSVKADQIQTVTVTLDQESAGFERRAAPEPEAETQSESESETGAKAKPTDEDAADAQDQNTGSPPAAETQWVNRATRQPIPADQIDTLLEELTPLECSRYVDDKTAAGLPDRSPYLKIEITGEKHHTLSLFAANGEEGEGFPGRSSQNTDAFILAQWKGEALEKKLKALISPEAGEDLSQNSPGQSDSP